MSETYNTTELGMLMEINGLMQIKEALLDALAELVERERAEAAAAGLRNREMTWLAKARRVIVKAKKI